MVHSGPHKSIRPQISTCQLTTSEASEANLIYSNHSYVTDLFISWYFSDILQSWTTVSLQCSLQTTELSTKAHHTHFCAKSNNPSCCSENSLEREEEEFFFDFLRKKFSTEKQIALEIKGNFCLWWWWLLLCQTLAKATPFLVKSWLLWHKFYLFFTGRICVIKLF